MWESVLFHQKNKSFPVPLRCSAVSHCHIHLSSELTELTLLTIHPNAFWLLGWNALSSNSQSESTATTALLLPSSRLQHWAADAVAYSTAAPWNTGFSAPRLFFVFSRSFFFLPGLSPFSMSIKGHPSAKYGSTFSCYPDSTVSALWGREQGLLLLALEGSWQTDTLAPALHAFVSIKIHFCPSDSLNRQHTKQVALWVPNQGVYITYVEWIGKLIVTLSTQGWSWPHPGQFFFKKTEQSDRLTRTAQLLLFLLIITFVSAAHMLLSILCIYNDPLRDEIWHLTDK